jgi:YbgC/YbaW family acyl-CoA thioester hydrolase
LIQHKTHVHDCEVSFDLLDPGQVVYHPNYLILCDRARSAALEEMGYSVAQLWSDGLALAVRENTSEYFKPARMGQKLVILTTLHDTSGTSLSLIQRILPRESFQGVSLQEGPFVEGFIEIDPKFMIYYLKIRLVCLNLEPFRPTRLPLRLSTALRLIP